MMARRTEEAYDRPSLHAELLTLLTSPDAYVAALVLLLGYGASEAVPQHQRGAPRNSSGLLSNVYLDDHEQACPHAHVHPRRARGRYMPCTRLTNTSLQHGRHLAGVPHVAPPHPLLCDPLRRRPRPRRAVARARYAALSFHPTPTPKALTPRGNHQRSPEQDYWVTTEGLLSDYRTTYSLTYLLCTGAVRAHAVSLLWALGVNEVLVGSYQP